ncbi:MAG: helix-turn-helix transcriptional regulator, partial [Actinophytocola sp.]|uniref:helix-turn-helix domain-containing protein n=1 Tax=Actinophytocola sp. TaxID=1872138 RepID=UPI003C71DFB8
MTRIRTILADVTSEQIDEIVADAETIRSGLEMFDLAQEYLAAGAFDHARQLLGFAAKYDIEGADALLADVAAIQVSTGNPAHIVNSSGSSGSSVTRDVWDDQEMCAALEAREVSTVYKLLRRKGVSQRQIAAMTGQSQSEVSEILKGRQVMAYDVLVRIAD